MRSLSLGRRVAWALAAATAALVVAGCGGSNRQASASAGGRSAGLGLPTRPVVDRSSASCRPPVRRELTAPGPFAVGTAAVPAQRPSSTTKGIRHIDPVVWYPLLPGVAHPRCRFPLIIISHGVNGKPTSYAYLAARLASEGFVVIGPHHGDQRSGGDEALERLKDMTFLLADLRSIADRVAPGLARRIDRRRIGVIGHSFGAHTVAQLAARDPQVKAAMIMAGGGDPATAASIHAPTLVVTSPDDRLVPVSFMERFFRSLPRSTPRGLMLIAGVPHTGFSRNCAASHACGILQRAATALFLTYLDDRRGAAGPIDPARPHSPRVSLTTDGMPPGRTH